MLKPTMGKKCVSLLSLLSQSKAAAGKARLETDKNEKPFKFEFGFYLRRSTFPMGPVWPDVGIKIVLMFPKATQKVDTAVFTLKVKYFKMAQIVARYFGLLLHEKLSPMAFKNRPIWPNWMELAFL